MKIDLIFWISIITVGAHLAITELIHFGLYVRFKTLSIDEWYSNLTDSKKTLAKPLFMCPTCMASIWGTSLYFAFGGELVYWIPSILAVAFFNTLLNKWVSN
jgi:hypothetical protein